MTKNVLITGASSGFGALAARALADAGHTVYAGMRDLAGRNRSAGEDAVGYAGGAVELHPVELDVADQGSVDAAVEGVLAAADHIDVVVHNAGRSVHGPAEAFTPAELAAVYDVNVLGPQRVNRAVLPHLRRRGDGLLVWVGSSSTRGGTPPYLAPYFAAKAAMDSLAVSYAAELARFGIETTIVVPGAFTTGTNHFVNAGHPSDSSVVSSYEAKYAGLMEWVTAKLAELVPAGQDPAAVAEAIVAVVGTPKGERPLRVHIDAAGDGAEVVNAVGDRVREEFYRRVGLEDLLHPVP